MILFASLLIQSVTGACGVFRFLCGWLLFCLGVCALSVWLFLVAFFLCATGHHFDKVLLIRLICFFKIPASRKQSCTFSELLFDSVRFILYSHTTSGSCHFCLLVSHMHQLWELGALRVNNSVLHSAWSTSRRKRLGHRNKSSVPLKSRFSPGDLLMQEVCEEKASGC